YSLLIFCFPPAATTALYPLSLHDALPISAIQRLQSIHHARQIFADGLITAPQLAQRPQSIFSVVDRSQHSRAQQVSQLARIHLRSEEHTSELQSRSDLVCRLLLEKKKKTQ